MRKRSGAIHSQSQQQYLELAQLSQEKTGIFYDQTILKTIIQPHQHHHQLGVSRKSFKKEKKQSSHIFQDFDYNQEMQEIKQEQSEVNMNSHQTVGAIAVIICQKIKHITNTLQNILKNNQPEIQDKKQKQNLKQEKLEDTGDSSDQNERDIDLVIGKRSISKTGIKYWIISSQFSKNNIALSYISKARIVYFINSSQDDQSDTNQLLNKIKNLSPKIKIQNYQINHLSLDQIIFTIIEDSQNL